MGQRGSSNGVEPRNDRPDGISIRASRSESGQSAFRIIDDYHLDQAEDNGLCALELPGLIHHWPKVNRTESTVPGTIHQVHPCQDACVLAVAAKCSAIQTDQRPARACLTSARESRERNQGEITSV